jgi:lipoprotein-releasing system permease protein
MISAIGVTIGVAALIVVISVFNGFGSLVKSILINFDPHVTIHAEALTNEERQKLELFLNGNQGIENYYEFAEGKVLLQQNQNYQTITLKGITEQDSSNSWGIKTSLLKGQINFDKQDSRIIDLLISQRMAIRLSVSVGDTIVINSFDNLQRMAIDFTAIPQTRQARINGVYATNNPDYDILFAYCPLGSAQSVLGIENSITGFEIRLKNIDDSDELKSGITASFPTQNLKVSTWYDLHKDLYNVMQIERWSAFILLSLIISVATFNILGSLTMSVIEKRRDIGVLRSIGMRINSITKIFMFEGILVGFIGTISGLAIGVLLCYLQIEYKFYALDPSDYIIDAIPVKLQIADIFSITLASLFLTFIASLYPARRAARVNLIESIKYE